MKATVKHLTPFFILLIALLPFCFLEKGTVLLRLNAWHQPVADSFFVRMSMLGNGLMVAFLFMVVVFFRYKWVTIFVAGFLVQVLVVLLFKKGIYAGELRPYLFYKNLGLLDNIHFVNGVKIRYVNSFPSGHTATIFFVASYFTLYFKRKSVTWVLGILALMVGISRIYLVQHFFMDVYFGMMFGVFSSAVAYYGVRVKPQKWYGDRLVSHLGEWSRQTQHVFRQLF